MPSVLPMVVGHTSAVLDIQWCPHNNDVIASASDDCTVKIWKIPEGGIGNEPLTKSIATLIGHQRRVYLVVWHPTAQGVIASSSKFVPCLRIILIILEPPIIKCKNTHQCNCVDMVYL